MNEETKNPNAGLEKEEKLPTNIGQNSAKHRRMHVE